MCLYSVYYITSKLVPGSTYPLVCTLPQKGRGELAVCYILLYTTIHLYNRKGGVGSMLYTAIYHYTPLYRPKDYK